MSNTHERLCAILIRDYKLAPERLRADAPLAELGIDSLGTVELMWTVEDSFGIKMPSYGAELHTLGEVVEFIDTLIARQLPPARSGVVGEAARQQAT